MHYSESCKDIIVGGGVGVMSTDTIYGIVGSAMNEKTIDRIYTVRKRSRRKPMIVLISSTDDFRLFGMRLGASDEEVLKKLWPGKVSVVLPCVNPAFGYLHCGTESLAFRVPDDEGLRNFLDFTGPIVAPSANPEGLPPAQTIEEAKDYFGADIDFYEDAGRLEDRPSTLVRLENGELSVLREGVVKISDVLK